MLTIGVILGALGYGALSPRFQPTPNDVSASEQPLWKFTVFAHENLWREKRAGNGKVGEEMLKRHALALTIFLRGDVHPKFTRTATSVQTREFQEIRIRVFDDNRLFGSGYDFNFDGSHGQLEGIRFVAGR